MSNSFDALDRDAKIKFWQDINVKIKSALELCADHISTAILKEALEYLDHNELGLAWEIFCGELVELDKAPSKSAQLLILGAGKRMGFSQPRNQGHKLWKSIDALFNRDS